MSLLKSLHTCGVSRRWDCENPSLLPSLGFIVSSAEWNPWRPQIQATENHLLLSGFFPGQTLPHTPNCHRILQYYKPLPQPFPSVSQRHTSAPAPNSLAFEALPTGPTLNLSWRQQDQTQWLSKQHPAGLT